MLTTDRLILRQWVEEDFIPFAKICADKDVMAFFPQPLSEQESFKMAIKIQSLIDERGWGFWAVELPGIEKFIGFVGLHTPTDALPFSPCVEIGWRLAKKHWGQGYATEAAKQALAYGFTQLKLDSIVSFTTTGNMRSQAVMQKIGMMNSGNNFMHPEIDSSHPQCEHVLYRISKPEWVRNIS